MEPSVIDERHAIGIAHADVPRCAPDDPAHEAAARLRSTPFTIGAVVNDEGIVLGRVDADSLDSAAGARVGDVMQEGPQTVRVDEELPSLGQRMDESSLDAVFVTDPDGRLVGLVTRADVQAASIHSGS